MTQIAVLTLGKLHLRAGTRSFPSFPTRQVEELFAYLLLYPNTVHSREKLIEILWPYQGGAMRGRFSTVLWRLRSTLDTFGDVAPTCLQITRDTISLSHQPLLDVDFVQFEQQLALAQTQANSEESEPVLRHALTLYQGDLYEGIYADWCLLERERMARLYLRGLGQLMAYLIQQQQYEEAILLGQRILQRDNLREEVHRAILYCYGQMGDYAAAAGQFQQCVQLLQDELHVPPMPETISLYQQIMRERVQQRLPATHPPHQAQIMNALADFENAAARLHQIGRAHV